MTQEQGWYSFLVNGRPGAGGFEFFFFPLLNSLKYNMRINKRTNVPLRSHPPAPPPPQPKMNK